MTALSWVRPPRQDRSQRTLDALLDAAEAQLSAARDDEIGVAGIAAAAGVSVGAFYGRFRSKADLLRALYARYAAESESTLAAWWVPEAWTGRSLSDIVGAMCAFIVEDYRERAGLRRAFARLVASDPEVGAMAADLTQRTTDALARLLEAREEEHGHPDPGVAAQIVHGLVFGALELDLRDGSTLPSRVLSDQLHRAVIGYLEVA